MYIYIYIVYSFNDWSRGKLLKYVLFEVGGIIWKAINELVAMGEVLIMISN